MKLIFLGTGGYHPNHRRHTAGLLLPEPGLVFDGGTSLFRLADRLQGTEFDLFLSHAHLDHIAGLTYLIVPFLDGRITRARVHSAPQYLAAVRTHLFAEPVFPVKPQFEFRELAARTELRCGAVVSATPLKHPGGSLGFRIDWPNKSLAYITDTTVDGSYTEFIRGVDLLVHECNFPDELARYCEPTGHSHTSQVARLAAEACVKRLLLTHIDPTRSDDDPIGLATARALFANTDLAEDLLEVEF